MLLKPNFDIVWIMKNEAKVLPRLLKSLEHFKQSGGKMFALDTGSTDESVKICRDFGVEVTEVGTKFLHTLDKELADKINKMFVVGNEEPIVKEGDKYFDFASARNEAANLSDSDWVSFVDCDEEFTSLDIRKINDIIKNGSLGNVTYSFVFSHQPDGSPAIAFTQSKFYNKKKAKWVNRVHEYVQNTANTQHLPEDVYKLEHWQNHETGRHTYLIGLAVDCYLNPENDRHSHYLAREMFWAGRPQSALREFKRHIAMNKWPQERSQSMIFCGDIYGQLGQPDKQAQWYSLAFHKDSSRREPLIKLANFYLFNKNYKAAIAYAEASLTIPYEPFYANFMEHYTHEPHRVLYTAYGWSGAILKAQEHITKALEYMPTNSVFLRDYRYYFTLPKISFLIPHLSLGNEEREKGLEKVKESIKKLNYPQDKIEIIVDSGEGTVPQKVNRMVEKATGEYVVYAANDMYFQPDSVIQAYINSVQQKKELVSFNEGQLLPDNGNICTHFLIKKTAINDLENGQLFSEDFHHAGCDNWLWEQMNRKGKSLYCGNAHIVHNHFSKNQENDAVYAKGWSNVEKDRETLKEKIRVLKEKSC